MPLQDWILYNLRGYSLKGVERLTVAKGENAKPVYLILP